MIRLLCASVGLVFAAMAAQVDAGSQTNQAASVAGEKDEIGRKAAELCDAGQYAEAEALLEKALAARPAAADLRCAYIAALWKAGKTAAAVKQFEALPAGCEVPTATLLAAANGHRAERLFDKARLLYRAVLDREPTHEDAARALVLTLFDLGRFDEAQTVLQSKAHPQVQALRDVRSLLSGGKRSAQDLWRWAQVLVASSAFEAALQVFDVAVKEAGAEASPELLAEYMVELARAGRADEAIQRYSALPKDVAARPPVALAAARSYLQKEQSTEAEELSRAVLAASPQDREATRVLVTALQAQDRKVEALAELDRALASGPPDPELLLVRGSVLLAGGDFSAAVKVCEDIRSRDPSNARAAALECSAFVAAARAARDVAETVLMLDRAVQISNGAPEVLAEYMLALERVDKAAEGVARYEQWRPQGQVPASLRRAAARCYRRAGQPGKAAEMYASLLKESPDDSEATVGLVQVALDAGDVAAAEQRLTPALAAQEGNVDLLFAKAWVELAKNEPTEALKTYAHLLGLGPDNARAIEFIHRFPWSEETKRAIADLKAPPTDETLAALTRTVARRCRAEQQYERAGVLYEAMLARDPENRTVLRELVLTLFSMGAYDKAMAALDRIAAAAPLSVPEVMAGPRDAPAIEGTGKAGLLVAPKKESMTIAVLERALRADAGREKEPPAERPQPKTVEDKGAQTPLKADAQAKPPATPEPAKAEPETKTEPAPEPKAAARPPPEISVPSAEEIKQLVLKLEQEAATAKAGLGALRVKLDAEIEQQAKVRQQEEQEKAELKKRADELSRQAEEAARTRDAARKDLEEQRAKHERLAEERRKKEAELARKIKQSEMEAAASAERAQALQKQLEQERAASEKAAADAQKKQAELTAQMEKTGRELAQASEAANLARAEAAERQQLLKALEAEAVERQQRVKNLESLATNQQQRVKALEAEAADRQQKAKAAQAEAAKERDALAARIQELDVALKTSTAQGTKLQEQLLAEKALREQVQAERARAEREAGEKLSALSKQAESAGQELAAVRKSLAEQQASHQAAATEANRRVEQLRQELEAKAGDAAKAVVRVRELEQELSRRVVATEPRYETLGAVITLLDLGLQDDALRTVDQALAQKPDDLDLLFTRASILTRKSDMAGAVRVYDRILELKSGHPAALKIKTQLLSRIGAAELAALKAGAEAAVRPPSSSGPVSPTRSAQVALDLLYAPTEKQVEQNVGKLVRRLADMGVDTVHVKGCSDPGSDGNVESVYFENNVLPVRLNLLGRVVNDLSSHGLKVYVAMPTLSVVLPTYDESLYVMEYGSSGIRPSSFWCRRLSPFHPKSRELMTQLYGELAESVAFHGILFEDDAYLTDREDFNPAAMAKCRSILGIRDPSARLTEADAKAWMQLKTQQLNEFIEALMKAVTKHRPKVSFSRSLYAPVLHYPRSQEWLAQSFDDAMGMFDYVVVMAYPEIEEVGRVDAWLGNLVQSASRHPNGLNKTIFRLQAYDAESKQWIPDAALAQRTRVLVDAGARHIAYDPDNFKLDRPSVRVMKPAILPAAGAPEP